jgi:hypothetical protein
VLIPRSRFDENNLRESEARRRLIEAIESISEGSRSTTPTIGLFCIIPAFARSSMLAMPMHLVLF